MLGGGVIIIITLSATYVGAFVYYNYDIEYVSYINSLGIYLKKGITYLFRGEDDLPITPPITPLKLEDLKNIIKRLNLIWYLYRNNGLKLMIHY